MMYIIKKTANENGSRPPLQIWTKQSIPNGYAICPDEFYDVFYSTSPAGFVNITVDNEVQQLPFFITNQMKFEAEEPSHGAFASLGYSLESLVYVYTLVTAYPKRCAVYKSKRLHVCVNP